MARLLACRSSRLLPAVFLLCDARFLDCACPHHRHLAWKVVGHAEVSRRKPLAFWLSFYFTVPLMLLDYAYCGLYLGHGWSFLLTYWYLTAFYVIPWLILLPIANVLTPAQPT